MAREAVIFRRLNFNMAHRLEDGGACENIHGHEIEVLFEVLGTVQTEGPERGMLMPFAELKKVLAKIHDLFDHNLVLRYGDKLIDTLTDRVTINNDGWRMLTAEMAADINRQGYWDSRTKSHNPHLCRQHMLVIAEPPTSENLAYLLHRMVAPALYRWKPKTLKVRFQETPNCGAWFSGAVRENPDFPAVEVPK